MWCYSDPWAAGFFDGEGCIQISPRQGKVSMAYYLTVQVTQNDMRPLLVLQAEFGGRVTKARPSAADRCSRWRASNVLAETFLRRVGPFLLVKREQCDLALQLRDLTGDRRSFLNDDKRAQRHDIYAAFRRTFLR